MRRWLKNRRRFQNSIADLSKEQVEKQLNLYFDPEMLGHLSDGQDDVIATTFITKNGELFYGGGDFKKVELQTKSKTRLVYRESGTGKLITLEETTSEAAETIFLALDGLDNLSPKEPSPKPPTNAEYLLHLFLRGDERDALIGDLIERYVGKHERFGERRAKVWFYSEVLRSLWPLLKRFLAKASGFIALGEWIRRHV